MPKEIAAPGRVKDEPGMALVNRVGMFAFTPPPMPQEAPVPCPHCAAREAIVLYATARTEYFRCERCRQIWTVSRDHEHSPLPAAA
jgi:hypothetical protein